MLSRQIQETKIFRIKELFKAKKYSKVVKDATLFLDMYPNNLRVRFMRAKSLRRMSKFDEAIDDLKYILKIDNNNQHAVTELYYLYYFLNRYEEAIELLPNLYISKNINSYSVAISELVMKLQLGLDKKMKKDNKCDYVTSQIFNYSTYLALSHLEKHIIGTDETISKFNKDININYLFSLVRENIQNSKKVNTEEILEIHYFAISNVGTYYDYPCNYIKVVVVPNTNNIISMYPTNRVDSEFVTAIDIDYNILFNKKEEKVKKLSQIDKFNNRYKSI